MCCVVCVYLVFICFAMGECNTQMYLTLIDWYQKASDFVELFMLVVRQRHHERGQHHKRRSAVHAS